MTVPDLDKRIDAAAQALDPAAFAFGGDAVARRDDAKYTAERVLRAAFPELFDGSAELVPTGVSAEFARWRKHHIAKQTEGR